MLPFAREEFVALSVASAGAGWVERFDRCAAAATTIRYATDDAFLGDDVLFRYGTELAMGLALLRARYLDAEVASARSVGRRPGERRGRDGDRRGELAPRRPRRHVGFPGRRRRASGTPTTGLRRPPSVRTPQPRLPRTETRERARRGKGRRAGSCARCCSATSRGSPS